MSTRILVLVGLALLLSACNANPPPGKACLGDDGGTLVEALGDRCKKGDIIATKHPGRFCNFAHTVEHNSYDSAYCVYIGEQRDLRE